MHNFWKSKTCFTYYIFKDKGKCDSSVYDVVKGYNVGMAQAF